VRDAPGARTRVRLRFGRDEGDDRWGPPVGDSGRRERAERVGGAAGPARPKALDAGKLGQRKRGVATDSS
jgi:hypothetical protein